MIDASSIDRLEPSRMDRRVFSAWLELSSSASSRFNLAHVAHMAGTTEERADQGLENLILAGWLRAEPGRPLGVGPGPVTGTPVRLQCKRCNGVGAFPVATLSRKGLPLTGAMVCVPCGGDALDAAALLMLFERTP